MSQLIEPIHVSIPDTALSDLRARLAQIRWPDRETVSDSSQGPQLAKVQAMCEYWLKAYDWQRCETTLNGLGSSRTTIDGLDIHFLHIRSPEPDAMPLLLTHGWPGSVLEFVDLIGPLTDPVAHGGDRADAFHLVIPSLPGFGFSEKPTTTGWDVSRTADAWITLMDRLGYTWWAAQGGDWGAAVTTTIGYKAPPTLAGIHLNMVLFQPTPDEIENADSDEQAMLTDAQRYYSNLSAYSTLHGTRPQTIGYSLADSPVGLAAWIYTLSRTSPTTPVKPRTPSPWTRCSTTSRSTGSPTPVPQRRACTGRAWPQCPPQDPCPPCPPDRDQHVPPRASPPFPPLGGSPLRRSPILQRTRHGRSLRGARAARAPGRRDPDRPPRRAMNPVLSDELVGLLRSAATCYIATIMPDGSPQLTQTWVDTDEKASSSTPSWGTRRRGTSLGIRERRSPCPMPSTPAATTRFADGSRRPPPTTLPSRSRSSPIATSADRIPGTTATTSNDSSCSSAQRR
jgi:pimeloyl-ACP methyl ester carboxylesterase